ncbi:hypothetical protein Tsubulata_021470 [Turnera subulata]|uniref:Pentatricopeptide repeat-containing protein n=1 Tax=Turnera subulata TaxID=218843 RepID=A0A9Q0JA13_9ROSI|nr:hypothetical protein Tsubulata_021470 [Turnera subulata]
MRVLSKFLEKGLVPDVFIYNSLTFVFCNFASTLSLDALIDGFCKLGRLAEAKQLWEDVVDKHLKPNHVTCTILIDCHCKTGVIEEAEQVFVDMRNRKLMPNVLTYTALLCGYNKMRSTSRMFSLFNEMVGWNIEPDKVICYVMIDAHLKEDNFIKILKLVDDVFLKGANVGQNVYYVLVDYLCKWLNMSEVLKLLEEGEKEDKGVADLPVLTPLPLEYTPFKLVEDDKDLKDLAARLRAANELWTGYKGCPYPLCNLKRSIGSPLSDVVFHPLVLEQDHAVYAKERRCLAGWVEPTSKYYQKASDC